MAGLLAGESPEIVLADPPGGVPVALAVCRSLRLVWGVFPSVRIVAANGETIGGAAPGGTHIDRRASAGLPPREVRRLRREALAVVRATMSRYAAKIPDVGGSSVLLVVEEADPSAVLAAVRGLRLAGAARVICGTPSATRSAVLDIVNKVDVLLCPNVRGDAGYSAGDAYSEEEEISREEALKLWQGFGRA